MNEYKTKLSFKEIRKKTISLADLKKNLTKEQKQIVENEKRYYKMVVGLKKAREKQGLTQEALARKANLPRTTITKIESGNRNATLETLMALAGAMGKRLEVRLT